MRRKPENESKAPTLSETFSQTVRLGLDTRGWKTLIPWRAFLAVACPIGVAAFWYSEMVVWLRLPGAVTILSAMMVIGGLLSSVCINIMRETYSLTSDKEFAAFLKKQDVFDQYLFWPQFILVMQLGLVVYCLSVISLIVIAPTWWPTPYLMAVSFGLLAYVAQKTLDLVDMVRVLVWHRQRFRELSET